MINVNSSYSNDLISRISKEIMEIKEQLQGFKEMQVSTIKDNYIRLQEYNSLSSSLNEIAHRFENVVKKFTEKEEASLEIAR